MQPSSRWRRLALLCLALLVSPLPAHSRALKGKALDLHLAKLDLLSARVEALQASSEVLQEQVRQNRVMRQTLSRETSIKIARLKKQMQADKEKAVADAEAKAAAELESEKNSVQERVDRETSAAREEARREAAEEEATVRRTIAESMRSELEKHVAAAEARGEERMAVLRDQLKAEFTSERQQLQQALEHAAETERENRQKLMNTYRAREKRLKEQMESTIHTLQSNLTLTTQRLEELEREKVYIYPNPRMDYSDQQQEQ